MITGSGRTVYFKSAAIWGRVVEWPLELFLLIVSESKTLEELKCLLLAATPVHLVEESKVAPIAVAAGAK